MPKVFEKLLRAGEGRAIRKLEAVALVAPLFLGPLMLGRPSSEAEIDRMVDLILTATRPRPLQV